MPIEERPFEDKVRIQLSDKESNLKRNKPCQHLDLGLPVSRSVLGTADWKKGRVIR